MDARALVCLLALLAAAHARRTLEEAGDERRGGRAGRRSQPNLYTLAKTRGAPPFGLSGGLEMQHNDT